MNPSLWLFMDATNNLFIVSLHTYMRIAYLFLAYIYTYIYLLIFAINYGSLGGKKSIALLVILKYNFNGYFLRTSTFMLLSLCE